MDSTRFDVTWIDAGREPTQPPDPRYPRGMDLDGSGGADRRCRVQLAYPVRRCGQYVLRCQLCGLTAVATTAGRPDDPRSITVACKPLGGALLWPQ